jgi:hypothetical protein
MIEVRRRALSLSPADAGLFFSRLKNPTRIIATLPSVGHRTVNFHATQWFALKAR